MESKSILWTALMILPPTAAMAAEGPDTGDTAWIIVSTALVMMMTPAGLALFYGNPGQVWIQVVSILGTAAFSAIGTLIVALVTKVIAGGLRVAPEEEIEGLDNAQHGERAFEIHSV
jgi:ammonia channel protein AmtB